MRLTSNLITIKKYIFLLLPHCHRGTYQCRGILSIGILNGLKENPNLEEQVDQICVVPYWV